MTNVTYAMIKPHVLLDGNLGAVITRIERAGFKILNFKQFSFTQPLLDEFYKEHVEKSFYPILCDCMLAGPVVSLVLEHKSGDSIKLWRDLIGATNPDERFIGTIRYDYALDLTNNAVHGSDSVENATREINLIFK